MVSEGGGSAPALFRSDEITNLLRKQAVEWTDPDAAGGACGVRSSCDVAFALFLEPRDDADAQMSTVEWITDQAIKRFSPSPVLAHCELVLPPIPDSAGGRTHFATYLGKHADWQNMMEKDDGVAFYLIDNGSRWRAVPVFGPNAVERARDACNANVDAPYALAQYPTSSWVGRRFAWLWSDRPRHMGHCATITARVLKGAGLGTSIEHPSAWYNPSSLYNTLLGTLGTQLEVGERDGLASVDPDACKQTTDALLLQPLSYQTVRDLGDAACIDAVRALTLRVCATIDSGTERESREAQKELANVLLRWVLLRKDEPARPTDTAFDMSV